MKNLVGLLVAFFFLTACQSIKSKNKEITDDNIVLNIGETTDIRLPSLATAGYLWKIQSSETPIVSVTESRGVLPKDKAVGASPDAIFTVKGLRKGSYQLHLEQRRPWESDTIQATAVKMVLIKVQ